MMFEINMQAWHVLLLFLHYNCCGKIYDRLEINLQIKQYFIEIWKGE